MTDLLLLPDENVEWTGRKGFFSPSLILGFVAVIGGGVLALLGFFGGESNGNPFPPNPILGWLGFAFFLLGVGYIVASLAVAKSTRYLLTDHRIVEVRFGKVVKEITLTDFMGKPISQFFDKQAAGTVNGQPVYDVCITNPKSLDPIEFKSVSESGVEALERILERARQVVRCRYCNTDNSATSFVCSHCGAPLP
jgi:hypothetical protein